MGAFSYLSVLLSVILGLAIQQVLQGCRALVLARARVRWHWPTLAWTAIILGVVAQHWWSSFGLSGHAGWTFAAFGAILVQTALIYMMAALVLPDVPAGEAIDLRAHYVREAPAFFGVGAAAVAWSLVREGVLHGALPRGGNLAFHLVAFGLSVVAVFVRRAWFHHAFAGAMAVMFTAYVAVLFGRLA